MTDEVDEAAAVNILAASIVDPTEYRGRRARFWAVLVTQEPDTAARLCRSIPGAVEERCRRCGIRVGVGPAQLRLREEQPEITFEVMCPVCAAHVSTRYHDVEHHHLPE